MNHRNLKSSLAVLVGASATAAASAQDTFLVETVPFINVGQFFMALISGILLAIGFQIVLSALTTAIGFSSLPNLVKRAENPPYPTGKKDRDNDPKSSKAHDRDADDADDSDGPSFPMTKITSAFGIWTMVTASISLFFASWLAIGLGVVVVPLAAVVIGLVIWATFFTLAAILEIKSITTLVGSLTSAVAQGIRASLGAVSSLTSKSPEQKLQQVADTTVERVAHELGRSFRDNDLEAKIADYIDQLSPPEVIDFDRMRDEIEQLINDIEVEENYTIDDDETKRRLVLNILSRQPRFSKSDLGKVKSLFGQAKDIRGGEGSPSDKAKAAFDSFSPGDEEKGRGVREKIENYLRHTDREELDPEAISDDIDRMIGNPGESKEVVRNRLSMLDRDTAKSILTSRADIGEDRAEKIVSTVEKAVNRIKSQFGSSKGSAETAVAEGKSRSGEAQSKAKSVASKAKSIPAKIQSRIEQSISNYLIQIDRPELSEAALGRDLEKILDNPKETPTVLKERLQELDRESVVAALAARENTSQKDAERIADKAIGARDNLMKRLHKIELAAKEKYYQSRYRLLKELEHLRRTGAAAAWWLLGTALVSGVAAAAGALVGIAML